jgi:DUF4097 and DUF4098 domain-containing protein YvlB
MSWFISLILAGAVLTSGNNIPNFEYQSTSANTPEVVKNVVSDVTEDFEKTYPFNPDGKIAVSNLNGSIYIEAWDRPEIQLIAQKVADSKERLSEVQIDIEDSTSNFRVKTDYKAWKDRTGNIYKSDSKYKNYGKLYVTFRLKVPRTAFLDTIETVNGSVEVSNMTNYTEITAVNGAVKASNLRGTAKLSTVNGTVYADFDDLNDSSSISLGTVNGSVKLNIPSTANATVKANTVNGSISNQFNLPVRKGKYVGRDLYGRIGNGNVKIKLSSVNGGLSINNKDGGTTNPAVNLLQQKTSDDFDDAFESSINVDTDKINKVIAKSVSESQKALDIAKIEMRNERQRARQIERDQKRAERTIERENARAKKEIIIDQEKLQKEVEKAMERVENDLVRASEALYLTRRSPFIQEKTGSFEVKGTPRVVIDADECNVVVRGWEKQEVKYIISRITRTGNETKDLRTRISGNKSEVEIEVTNDSPATSTASQIANQVRVEVFVPKKSNLKISSNREIRLEGVNGELELNGNDGSINVRDSQGRLKVESVDGTVRIVGFNGVLETTSVDGDVYLEGNFEKIRSESNDGNVYLTLFENANATLITNGIVDFRDIRLRGEANVQKGEMKTLYVGNGDSKYNFEFAQGKLIVRPKSSLNYN